MTVPTSFQSVADIELFMIEYDATWGGTDEDCILILILSLKEIMAQRSYLVTERVTLPSTGTVPIAAPMEHLDFDVVMAVSQAVSGEIVLEKLLNILMRTAIKYAGAECALLILLRAAEQRIAGEATTTNEMVNIQLCDKPVSSPLLPEAIIRYVLQARESVIWDDAAIPNPFSTDRYMLERRVRSVLCLSLMNQAKLIGVRYAYEKEWYCKDGSRVSALIGGALFEEKDDEGGRFRTRLDRT